ncbi:MAG: glycosyltransferase family 2 protein, partial [Marinilabilia sp.]
PVQEMHTTGEWLLVAQVNVILVSLLPLAFSRYIPFNLVTAANGQFMMFDAGVYDQQRFHEKLRTTVVEDVAIAQYIKGKGLKIRTALSPAGLSCRMYHNYREALNGLGRSARFFFGGSIIAGWLYVFFALFGWLAVLLAFPMIWLAVYFLLLVTMRIFVAIASRQSVMKNILLMPLQPITLFHLFFTATRQHVQQKSTWKGRPL